jgi:hypothetical protein
MTHLSEKPTPMKILISRAALHFCFRLALTIPMLLLFGTAHSYTCRRNAPPPYTVQYEIEAGSLLRNVNGKKSRVPMPKLSSRLVKVSQSRKNCNANGKRQVEPNIVALLFEDGSVWARVKIYNYGFSGSNGEPADITYSSNGKWFKIMSDDLFKDIGVGETYVGLLRVDGVVMHWGGDISGVKIHNYNPIKKNYPSADKAPPREIQIPPPITFNSIEVYDAVTYGIDYAGRLWGLMKSKTCPQSLGKPWKIQEGGIESSMYPLNLCLLLEFSEFVDSIKVIGVNTERSCRATLTDGSAFEWSCDGSNPPYWNFERIKIIQIAHPKVIDTK